MQSPLVHDAAVTVAQKWHFVERPAIGRSALKLQLHRTVRFVDTTTVLVEQQIEMLTTNPHSRSMVEPFIANSHGPTRRNTTQLDGRVAAVNV